MTEIAVQTITKTVVQATRNYHHLWFTRRAYKSKLELDFRNLPCAIIDMDYWAHQLIHEVPNTPLRGLYEPPRKPRVRIMELFVYRHRAGLCDCKTAKVKVSIFGLIKPSQVETCHLPCAYLEISPEQLRIVRSHYREHLLITPENRFAYQSMHLEYLESIHALGFCSCHHEVRHIYLEKTVTVAA